MKSPDNYTIVDWLKIKEYKRTVENAPYELTTKDLDEINNGEYLNTKKSIIRVVKSIAKYKSLDVKNRQRIIVDQRNYLFFILRARVLQATGNKITYPEIADIFNKDHSTVIHGIKLVEYLKVDRQFNKNIKELKDFFDNTKYKAYI
jgi:chromosomal replication initiation ATPase DnaA